MDHEIVSILFVPIVLFVLFVAPIWLILHYRERRRERERLLMPLAGGSTPDLDGRAERMEQRIAALESLLDVETPGWRKRHD